MPGNRVVCISTAEPHDHVVTVGTAGSHGAPDWHWPIAEVLRALDAGESFYTISPSTGDRAELEVIECPVPECSARTVRADAEAAEDSGLDRLAACG